MTDNWLEFLYNLAETLKSTFSGLLGFLTHTISIGSYSWQVYELLFGGAIFTVIIWGIVSFIIDILP